VMHLIGGGWGDPSWKFFCQRFRRRRPAPSRGWRAETGSAILFPAVLSISQIDGAIKHVPSAP